MGKGKKKKKNKNVEKKEEVGVIESENDYGEKLLIECIELIYKLAVYKLVKKSGLEISEAVRAIFLKGSLLGDKRNILFNILNNSLKGTDYHRKREHNMQPHFQNFSELARYSLQRLINMIVNHPKRPSKKVAIMFLYCSQFVCFDVDDDDEDDDDEKEDYKDASVASNISILFKEMLKQQKGIEYHPHKIIQNSQSSSLLSSSESEGIRFRNWLFEISKYFDGEDEWTRTKTKIVTEEEVLLQELRSFIKKEILWFNIFWEDYKVTFESDKSFFILNKIIAILDLKRVYESFKTKVMGRRHQELNQELEKTKMKLKQTREEVIQNFAQLLEQETLCQLEKIKLKYLLSSKTHIFKKKAEEYMDELIKDGDFIFPCGHLVICSHCHDKSTKH